MAAVAPPPSVPQHLFRSDSEGMNTLPNPRSTTPSTPLSRSDSATSGHHPDLNDEIAMLSAKLVKAINFQTSLDDQLHSAREELERARRVIAELEAAKKQHEEAIRVGSLVRKEEVEKIKAQLYKELDAARNERSEMMKEKEKAIQALEREQAKRAAAEKSRKEMEQELENLTSALFEEANGMVADARKETEASEKRNESLRNQLNDAEVLLRSHQEQLQDLKAVVEKISSERDENESNVQTSTAPSTPGMAPHDKMSRLFESANLTPVTPGIDDIQPDQPLKFSHLITPVMRYDLSAFEDFKNLIKAAAKATPAPSRVASGSFGSVNVLGLERSDSTKSSKASSPAAPVFPTVLSSPKMRDFSSSVPQLKDTPVYKRALAEDIEPTMRLDSAPGVGWMAKRTILNSMTAGTLVVEPMPTPMSRFRGPVNACALCGENRKTEPYQRKLCFRVTETEDAQRYPLCDYCLGRVRMSCDYIAFLRMIRDGHWRADSDEEIKAAWDESVKLRERMFWQRLGGGVLPAYMQNKENLRSPTFEHASESGRNSEEAQRTPPQLPPRLPPRNSEDDPFQSEKATKRVSIGEAVVANNDGHSAATSTLTAEEEKRIEEQAAQQLQDEARHSYTSKSSGSETVREVDEQDENASTPAKDVQRLSLTIPGSFQ
ncbi:uncharacterized protein PV09_04905 [Verruconis gallopava]|uniref:GDP/GTP exchange factor Sec2 N-terminal domain-containing protein n=1 Tax=Verruconis gallopava TaxID=253628 RepID=A0A0D2ABC0_9PEZI|nr:uncharacterized protein PV09_04905 [Verruconis gallopava]KIW04088.1 hypothetical protein PV09_04905 [Verruconis gallopava]